MASVAALKLSDIASSEVLTVPAGTPLGDAVARLAERYISSLVVVDGARPVGILTEWDLLRLLREQVPDTVPVYQVMSAPLVTTRPDIDFAAAQLLMSSHAIRHLVLVDGEGRLAGLASESDFRRQLDNALFEAIRNLQAIIEPIEPLLAPEQALIEVLDLMAERRLDHVLIGRDGVAQGIITERDLPRLMQRRPDLRATTAGSVMSAPLQTIDENVSVAEAARRMAALHLRHLVVCGSHGRAVGVIGQHRLLERLSVVLMESGRSRLASQLEVVLEATGVGTWEYDHRRDVVIRSAALNSVLQFARDKVFESFADMLERVVAEDRDKVRQAFHEALAGSAGQFAIDFRVRDGEGQMRWFSSRGRVIERDAGGRPLHSAGVAIDIDPQKRQEAELRRSEARFRDLLEQAPLPMGYVNADGSVAFLNRRFAELFGYALGEVPNLRRWSAHAFPDPDYRAVVAGRWRAAVATARAAQAAVAPVECAVTCGDGSVRIVEIAGVLLGDDCLVTFIDITAQREQQQRLEFGNAILRLISDDAPLPDVLDQVCRRIEARDPALRCSVLLLDDDGRHLRHGAAPSLPGAYCQAIDGAAIGPAGGSCGTAAWRGEAVLVTDIASDPLWADYRQLALPHRLAACWSSPIKARDGRVLGTFAIYWAMVDPEIPAALRDHVDAATTLSAIAIESAQREAAVRSMHRGLSEADLRLRQQLDELRRWQQVVIGREERVLSLKQEVNALCQRLGEPARYASVELPEGRS